MVIYEVHVPVVLFVEVDPIGSAEERREARRVGVDRVRAATRGMLMVAQGSLATVSIASDHQAKA